MLAVIPVRDGVLPAGALETIDECGGRSVLIGTGARPAAAAAAHLGGDTITCEVGAYRPGSWAEALATALADEPIIVLPSSPDGRDLGPRLAASLDRPFFAGSVQVSAERVVMARGGGLTMHTTAAPAAFVATLQVGVRGTAPHRSSAAVTTTARVLPLPELPDAATERVVEPDAATIDLAEAGRIVGGGAGLAGPDQFAQLARLGLAIGASVGATRVITDRGWIGHERQIGTTGVVVDPQLYLAFGISGAVQHTSGLGRPEHVVSVNTDAHCPMMQLADLAVVGDANAVLAELIDVLEVPRG